MSEDRKLQEPEARFAFEKWATKNGYSTRYAPNAECGVEGGPVYDDCRTHAAWWAYRAALSTPPAPEAASVVPEGWSIETKGDKLIVTKRRDGIGLVMGYAAKHDDENIASAVLHELASDLLASTVEDDCAAIGFGACHFRPIGPRGAMQCQYCGEPPLTAPAAPEAVGELTVEQLALEECLQLGYSIENGALLPPDSPEWDALATTCLRKKGVLRG